MQAAGMLSVQAACTLDEAIELMVNRAELYGQTREEIATAVIDRSIRFGPDRSHCHTAARRSSRPVSLARGESWMFVCSVCREEVDPASPDVIALRRWQKLGSTFGGPAEWVEGVGAHFHRRHAPALSLECRLPAEGDRPDKSRHPSNQSR
jgi:hypothetical protein